MFVSLYILFTVWNFSDTSSEDSTFPGLDILCRPSSLRPTNSSVTGDIPAAATCCRGNSLPSTSSADSSSSSDSITETSIAGKRPKRYYWLHILPSKCVKVQLDRLELLAMLDRYCRSSGSICIAFHSYG